jgi:hypothetical protein
MYDLSNLPISLMALSNKSDQGMVMFIFSQYMKRLMCTPISHKLLGISYCHTLNVHLENAMLYKQIYERKM